ncbi:hypothetical protein BDV93DRAFT_518094 [Ceratobasidium sp. AG-I]|nr:hypothetical protein BDV93DRAFT_518094 [Ceratobasidium sp. AG-I]
MADTQTEYEDASSRATRARTRLIVEGFANLALVAILFCGVQAQLISVTNQDNDNKLSIATNAVFFGGLIFSVFTAMLATLSGRWFSILREDDADYLSSRWLAQDCAEEGKAPCLEDYLAYQVLELELKKLKEELELTPDISEASNTDQPAPGANQAKPFNPNVYDIERIIKLLKAERKNYGPNEKIEEKPKRMQPGKTTWRERVVSWTLISPLAVCCAAFMLFCAGIIMLTWNKQPREVAIFTSATVLCCVFLLGCFFLRHRHKHVIKNLYLSRPAL